MATSSSPLVRAVDRTIAKAIREGASDVHFEPWEREVLIRFRVDGVLRDITTVPKMQQDAMISRVKVMASLNIAERPVPQDGRMSVLVDRERVDLRVATLPTRWGEKIAIRILSRASGPSTLADLGFDPQIQTRIRPFLRKPHGAILVAGPTGSGKSSTLYSMLEAVNDAGRSIVTVEDPVERLIPRVMQIQVNPRAGLTFAMGLRSILRSDPDVVMIGEIRDRETAMIAMESALTGHLVLSTLHTNDAPSAVARLIEMGVEPFIVASAVNVVLAQRLVRRLCTRCRELEGPPVAEAIRRRFPSLAGAAVLRPVGCSSCFHVGYSGRVAIAELMQVTDSARALIMDRRPADEIRPVAVAETGMRSLLDDGLDKVRAGLTTVPEVLRVVADEQDVDDAIPT